MIKNFIILLLFVSTISANAQELKGFKLRRYAFYENKEKSVRVMDKEFVVDVATYNNKIYKISLFSDPTIPNKTNYLTYKEYKTFINAIRSKYNLPSSFPTFENKFDRRDDYQRNNVEYHFDYIPYEGNWEKTFSVEFRLTDLSLENQLFEERKKEKMNKTEDVIDEL